MGLIEGALARSKNLASNSVSDVFDFAAEFGYVIARKHGFIDGKKRTAYVVTLLFLRLNGHDLTAPAIERFLVFEKLGRRAYSGRLCQLASASRKKLRKTMNHLIKFFDCIFSNQFVM
jgi:death-on-curing protein